MKNKPCVLTLGSYDGVHLGHVRIIKKLIESAKKLKVASKVLFFPIPPKLYIKKNAKGRLITTAEERINLIKSLGVDEVEKIDFDKKILNMPAEKFFQDIFIVKHSAKGLIVGKDFAFGKDRAGNLNFLKKKSKETGIFLERADFVKMKGQRISSSLIREFLSAGDVFSASKAMGRPYFLTGTVVKGAGMGRKIGYPTANLELDPHKILPLGVYAGKAFLDGKRYNCVLSSGFRPTLNTLENKLVLEAHILDFDRMIYKRKLTVEFIAKIRNEMKFKDLDFLIAQIAVDIKKSKKFFVKVSSVSR